MSRLTFTASYLISAVVALAQSTPPGDCVVNILNRTAIVGTDGRWRVEGGEPLEEVIQVRVDVRLPGKVESNALASGGDRAVWQVGFGERSVAMEATGRERRVGTLVAAGVAAACGLGLVISGAVALVRRGRHRRAT